MAFIRTGTNYALRFDVERLAGSTEESAKLGLAKAAIMLTGYIKDLLSKPGPIPARTRRTERERRERLAKAAGETNRASRPGEPPRRRTGTLRASIRNEPEQDGFVQKVGSPHNYAFWLEFGTAKMEPRPYLRRALAERSSMIREIVIREMKR